MTEPTPTRGPDFLPYPLPERPLPPPAAPVAPPAPPRGRVAAALDGLSARGRAAVTGGAAALLSLLVVSLLGGHRGTGAVLAVGAAAVAGVAASRALKEQLPADSRLVVQGSAAAGVASAVVAVALVLTSGSSVGDQPPVRVPLPAPSASSAPTAPELPSPAPSAGAVPPGSDDLFGVPTQPDDPTVQDSTAKGTLQGRVVSTSGAPLAGATVVVTRADPADTSDTPECPLKITTRTGADGRYRLQLCQLGDQLGYTVTITAGSASAHADLYVNAGQVTVYNVILPVRRA
ncbi:MAG: carboxypeptidase-like regulatory domain-containing protein [Mycobacteriales bacterium]